MKASICENNIKANQTIQFFISTNFILQTSQWNEGKCRRGQWMEIFLKLIINSLIREIEMVDKWTNFENKRLYAMSSENQKSGGKKNPFKLSRFR